MLHLLGARLLLSPAISSFLIKRAEGSKYTLAFSGKLAVTATCACARVCVCMHVNHGWASHVQLPVTNKEELPTLPPPAASSLQRKKISHLGVHENLDLNGTIFHPPPHLQVLHACLSTSSDPRELLFSRTPSPALGSPCHHNTKTITAIATFSPCPSFSSLPQVSVKEAVGLHHPLCRRRGQTQASSPGLTHTKCRKALSASQEDREG